MDEIEKAKNLWIINEQDLAVSGQKLVNNLSYSLDIFKDVDGINRSRGRLADSDLDVKAKYPISL